MVAILVSYWGGLFSEAKCRFREGKFGRPIIPSLPKMLMSTFWSYGKAMSHTL